MREEVTKLFNDYFKIIHKASYGAKHEKGLKILSAEQILQRLPIALAQVKAANTSKNLLNEIRQSMHSLYQAKNITENIYNNTI